MLSWTAALIICLSAVLANAKPNPHGPPISRYYGSPGGVDSYIIGGKNALPGAWPWQLSLQVFHDSVWQHACGASLLTAIRGLSAAHCVEQTPASNLRVVAGLHDRSEMTGTQVSRLSGAGYISHANFNRQTLENDIAILLFEPITPDDFKIMFATLPSNNANTFTGTVCVLTGWGRTSHVPDSEIPYILQQVNIPIITSADCANRLSNAPGSVINSNNICAFDNEHGMCSGDSGGPMNCPDSTGYVVAGVTSWGVSQRDVMCLTAYPSVYTRTSAYLDWIASNIV